MVGGSCVELAFIKKDVEKVKKKKRSFHKERKTLEGQMIMSSYSSSYSISLGLVPFIDWKDFVMSRILVEGKRNI